MSFCVKLKATAALAALLTVTVFGATGMAVAPKSAATVTDAATLPGEQSWNGVGSYVFGTNDAIEYASPNVDTLPSVQATLKAGGLTLMRTWAYSNYSDADINQRSPRFRTPGCSA